MTILDDLLTRVDNYIAAEICKTADIIMGTYPMEANSPGLPQFASKGTVTTVPSLSTAYQTV